MSVTSTVTLAHHPNPCALTLRELCCRDDLKDVKTLKSLDSLHYNSMGGHI